MLLRPFTKTRTVPLPKSLQDWETWVKKFARWPTRQSPLSWMWRSLLPFLSNALQSPTLSLFYVHDNLDLLIAAAEDTASIVMDFWLRGIEQSTIVLPQLSTIDYVGLNATAAFANTTQETVQAPRPTTVHSPFETIALVESWMTPSYFDEHQGLAFFGLQEVWFPTIIIQEEQNDLDADVVQEDCCQQNDLACRVKAITSDCISEFAPGLLKLKMIAVDYVPALAPYLLDETAHHASQEDDHEDVYDDGTLDFVGFFLQHEHTLFRVVEIPKPTISKPPVLLKQATFTWPTPATIGSARCDHLIASRPPVVVALEDGLSPHYHQCMQWSYINMSPADPGRFTADGTDEERNAPTIPSLAHALGNSKSSPALSDAAERFTADSSGPTPGRETTDLAPMLSPALFVPRTDQTLADGVGESLSFNKKKSASAHPAGASTLVCSSDDSLLDIASEAMQLVQTYLHEKKMQFNTELQTNLDANPTLKTIFATLGGSKHPDTSA